MSSYVNWQEVREILFNESRAIERAAQNLNPTAVDKSLSILFDSSGKVIVCGVGKSGDVGRKIVATLNSTGTMATFLHPSDALHGDLGLVSHSDVAILLSNSGETDELLSLLPHLKSRNIQIIALLGNTQSTLARLADVVIDASVEKEACPLNLAPSASTTVALAIGDALALVLMTKRGLTPSDFAFNHPAGRLGKRLTLKVKDLMHQGKWNPVVNPSDNWIHVIGAVSSGGLGAVNVVDDNYKLIGFITDGDIRRVIQGTKLGELEKLIAEDFMTKNPISVSSQILAYDALRMMEDRQSPISHLPVLDDNGTSIGLLRLHDLIRSGLI
jgi:arabinose-5-phosphate isomerase